MSLKKNISYTFGSQIINTFIGLIISIIVTRILGAEGRGENAIFSNATSFAVLFFGFSINSTVPYFLNSLKTKPQELLSTILVYIFFSSFVVFCTLYILEKNNLLHLALPQKTQSIYYIVLFTLLYITTLLNSVLNTFLVSFKKFKEASIISIITQIIPLSIYLCIYKKIIVSEILSPFQIVFHVTMLVSFFTLVVTGYYFIIRLKIFPSKSFISKKLIQQFISFSLLAYIGNVATFFNYRLDFWVVDSYCGKQQLGIYSLAAQLSQLLWILPQAISTVLYSYASSSSLEESVRYAINLKQLAFIGTLVLSIIGMILAYFLLPTIYGTEFTPAIKLMFLLMIGIIPFSIPTVLSSLFAARGNFKISFYISIIIFFISSTLYFILIPKYGTQGGIIASAIAYLLAAILCEWWFCKEYQISPSKLFTFDKNIFSKKGLLTIFK